MHHQSLQKLTYFLQIPETLSAHRHKTGTLDSRDQLSTHLIGLVVLVGMVQVKEGHEIQEKVEGAGVCRISLNLQLMIPTSGTGTNYHGVIAHRII